MSRFQAQLSLVDADHSGSVSYCVSVCGYNDCWDDSWSVAYVTCSICASSALHAQFPHNVHISFDFVYRLYSSENDGGDESD